MAQLFDTAQIKVCPFSTAASACILQKAVWCSIKKKLLMKIGLFAESLFYFCCQALFSRVTFLYSLNPFLCQITGGGGGLVWRSFSTWKSGT